MTTYCDKLPRRYAESKLGMMRERWLGQAGAAVRRFGARLWPGVPPTMLLAFSSNSMGPQEAISDAGFWEIGLYQTPAGSPSSRPPAPGSSYARIGADAEVVGVLGRPAILSDSGWSTDIDGQVAIGIIDYRNGGRSLAERLPSSVRPSDPSSPWSVALGILAYVDPSSAARVVNGAADVISGFDETQRFPALCAHVAARFQRTGVVRSEGYPLVRAMQRFAVGRKLAESVGESTAWWPAFGPDEEAIAHWLTTSRYGSPSPTESCLPASTDVRVETVPVSKPQVGVIVGSVAAVAAIAAIAGGGWWWLKRR